MRPIRLSAHKIIRCKGDVAAAEILAGIPAGYATRNGNEVILLRALDMTFSVPPDRPFQDRISTVFDLVPRH